MVSLSVQPGWTSPVHRPGVGAGLAGKAVVTTGIDVDTTGTLVDTTGGRVFMAVGDGAAGAGVTLGADGLGEGTGDLCAEGEGVTLTTAGSSAAEAGLTGVDVARGFIGSVGGMFMYSKSCCASLLKTGDATCPPYSFSAPSRRTRMMNRGSATGANPICEP